MQPLLPVAKKASCWTPEEVSVSLAHLARLTAAAAVSSLPPLTLAQSRCRFTGCAAARHGEDAWRPQLEEDRGEPFQ
jgi:hypothetical protein